LTQNRGYFSLQGLNLPKDSVTKFVLGKSAQAIAIQQKLT